MDSSRLAAIDAVVSEGLRRGEMAGAVVTIGRSGKIVFQRAYGHRQVEPEPRPMEVDSVFDLASLTKPVATATSIMLLIERGRLELDEPVAGMLPSFAAGGKQDVTVRHLLTHQSGLIADNALSDYRDGRETAFERIDALSLKAPPGERFTYSDVGFIVLGRIVEQISGRSLAEFTRNELWQPLGMDSTGFVPNQDLRERAVTTERRDNRWLSGEVHDPRAAAMDGTAGHAGLFSTADDLAVFAQMLLGGGTFNDTRILKASIVEQMIAPHETSGGLRTLGWDNRSVYSSNRGDLFSERAFGHGGFTGTAMWIDPELDLFVIFLSNRLHPDGKGSVNRLAGRIGTLAAAAICSCEGQ